MLFIFNKTINTNKILKYTLTTIFGLNQSTIYQLCFKLGLNPYTTLKTLSPKKLKNLIFYIEKNFKLEKELKHHLNTEKKLKLNMKLIRSIRLFNKLPVNGQRSKTNSKTIKRI